MEKFAISVNELKEMFKDEGKVVRIEKTVSAVSQLRQIAYGLYSDDKEAGAWKVEKDEGGKEWLVRIEEAEVEAPGWRAEGDSESKSVTLSFKETPIHKFDAKFYGFDEKTIGIFKKSLLKKIATDTNFRRQILSTVPAEMLLQLQKKV